MVTKQKVHDMVEIKGLGYAVAGVSVSILGLVVAIIGTPGLFQSFGFLISVIGVVISFAGASMIKDDGETVGSAPQR